MFRDSEDFDGDTNLENMSGQTRSYKWRGGELLQATAMINIAGKVTFYGITGPDGVVLLSGVYMASQLFATAAFLAVLHF